MQTKIDETKDNQIIYAENERSVCKNSAEQYRLFRLFEIFIEIDKKIKLSNKTNESNNSITEVSE